MKIENEMPKLLNIHPDPIMMWGVYLSIFIGFSGIVVMIFYSLLNKERKRKEIPEALANKFLSASTTIICLILIYQICAYFIYILAPIIKSENLIDGTREIFEIINLIVFPISSIILVIFLIGFLPYLIKINTNKFTKAKKLDSIFIVLFVLFLGAAIILQFHYRKLEIGEFYIPSYDSPSGYGLTFEVYDKILTTSSILLATIFIFISLILLNKKSRQISLIVGKQPRFYSHYFVFAFVIVNQAIVITSIILHDISYTQFYNTYSFFYFAYIISEIIQYSSFIALFIELAIKIKEIDFSSEISFEQDEIKNTN